MSTAGGPALEELRAKLAEARRLAAAGRFDEAKRLAEHIAAAGRESVDSVPAIVAAAEDLEQSLEKRSRLRKNRLWIVAITAVSGLGLVLLVWWRAPVEVDAEIIVRELQLTLAEATRTRELPTPQVTLSRTDVIRTSGVVNGSGVEESIQILPEGEASSTTIRGDGLRARFVEIGRSESVTLFGSSGVFRIGPGAAISGDIQPDDSIEIQTREARCCGRAAGDFALHVKPMEGILFEGGDRAVVEIVNPEASRRTVLTHFGISALSLLDQNQARPRSTVQGGVIRFPSSRRPQIELRLEDALALRPRRTFRVAAVDAGDDLRILLHGEAEHLELNGRSLQPSWLEAIHQDRRLALYLAALSSLLSFLWLALKRLEVRGF